MKKRKTPGYKVKIRLSQKMYRTELYAVENYVLCFNIGTTNPVADTVLRE